MAGEGEWITIGFLVGLAMGLTLGLLLLHTKFTKPTKSSVIFERDERSNITAIHYIGVN